MELDTKILNNKSDVTQNNRQGDKINTTGVECDAAKAALRMGKVTVEDIRILKNANISDSYIIRNIVLGDMLSSDSISLKNFVTKNYIATLITRLQTLGINNYDSSAIIALLKSSFPEIARGFHQNIQIKYNQVAPKTIDRFSQLIQEEPKILATNLTQTDKKIADKLHKILFLPATIIKNSDYSTLRQYIRDKILFTCIKRITAALEYLYTSIHEKIKDLQQLSQYKRFSNLMEHTEIKEADTKMANVKYALEALSYPDLPKALTGQILQITREIGITHLTILKILLLYYISEYEPSSNQIASLASYENKNKNELLLKYSIEMNLSNIKKKITNTEIGVIISQKSEKDTFDESIENMELFKDRALQSLDRIVTSNEIEALRKTVHAQLGIQSASFDAFDGRNLRFLHLKLLSPINEQYTIKTAQEEIQNLIQEREVIYTQLRHLQEQQSLLAEHESELGYKRDPTIAHLEEQIINLTLLLEALKREETFLNISNIPYIPEQTREVVSLKTDVDILKLHIQKLESRQKELKEKARALESQRQNFIKKLRNFESDIKNFETEKAGLLEKNKKIDENLSNKRKL